MSATVIMTGVIASDISVVGRGQTQVCNFEVMVRDGKEVEFIPCTLWGKPIETLARYGRRNGVIEVVGRWQSSKYIPKGQHQEVKQTFVLVDRFELIGNRPPEQLQFR